MTKPDLKALVAEWQFRLKLQDWDVRVRYCRRYDMPAAQGECRYTPEDKKAVVTILDPNDYEPNDFWPQDVEETVVHELLHLHLGTIVTIDAKDDRSTVQEQVINAIAHALVETKRMAARKKK